jgi:HEAT repeat protein
MCNRILVFGIVVFITAFAFISKSPAVRAADDDAVDLILTLLADNDKEIRSLALEQVRTEAKGEAATKKFAAQLKSLPPESQIGLLSALADRGDKAAKPAVLETLKSNTSIEAKVAAIEALGHLGDAADLALLMQLLDGGSKAEQEAARKSLVRIPGDAVVKGMADAVKQAKRDTRVALIHVLATRRALPAVPALLAAATDNEAAVRAAAMVALAQLGGPEHINGMVQGVLKAQKGPERDAAERAVMTVLAKITDADKRAEPLIAAMNELPESDRLALMPTLGRVGGSSALKVIEAAIADSNPDRHETGVRALCNWPDASTAQRIIELANSDDHAEHRSMALAALIRVAPLPDKRPDSERLDLLKKAMSMCTRDADRTLVLRRARAIRSVDTLRFLVPYMDQPEFAQMASESVVELAHHRNLRQPNKAEFDKALDKVIATSKDAVVVERAGRYKRNQTWARPTASE